jgi:hypothetical protein
VTREGCGCCVMLCCAYVACLQITVPGPHTASVLQAGRSITMNLTPLGPSHPPLNTIGLTSSLTRCVPEPGRKARSSGLSVSSRLQVQQCCQLRSRLFWWRAHSGASHAQETSADVSCDCCFACCFCCVLPGGLDGTQLQLPRSSLDATRCWQDAH